MPDGTVYGRMKKLQQIGCISMQPNTHFTIVTICNWNRYQRPQRKSPQATAHPSNTQPNTGEEESKRTNTLSRAKLRFDDGDMDLAKLIWGKVHELHPSRKAPNLDQWANEVRLLRERDGRTLEDARELFSLANADSSFWAANVMSPAALRKHWDQLDLKLRRRPAARPGSNGASRSPTRIHQRNINDYCS
ncbi:MAG TPA: hypothetical protein VG826_34995 [Pirellulales bacterium]|nr:hypothetical protein [Pirellulales bacterium]